MLRSEAFERLLFRRGGKGEVGAVGGHLAREHQFRQHRIRRNLLVLLNHLLHRGIEFVGGDTALRRVRLVDDDGKVAVAHVADGVADERELLNGGRDDALALFHGHFQFRAVVGVLENLVALPEGFQVVGNLLVQHTTVSDDNHRGKERSVERLGAHRVHRVRAKPDEFVSQPCERVALARTGRVLNEVRLAHAHLRHVGGEAFHHVELVVTGEDKHLGVLHDVRHTLLRLCLTVVEERVVGDDVRDRVLLQGMLPEV